MGKALYRKYRSRSLDEIVGQSHITSLLKRAISSGNVAHAYLLTGPRGVGKTSIARILAHEINGLPYTDESTHLDIIEIDAASNRSVADMDTLRAGVRTFPFSSPYKVYIIDEVHMLSTHAFNALLKTLEEPPAHVIFILATTELAKVPETILSRCQIFSFRKPTERILTDMVTRICDTEKIAIDAESAALVAFLGDGSFRDTYSMLQKVISAAKHRTIDRALVESVTGAPSLSLIRDLYSALITKDLNAAYATLAHAQEHHTDMMLLAELLLDTMRHSLMYRYAPDMREKLESEHGEQYIDIIKRGAVESTDVISSRGIVSLITAIERIAYAAIPTLPLELAFIEMTGAELKS